MAILLRLLFAHILSDFVFHQKKVAHSPVNVSTSYVLGVYFLRSRHPF